MSAARGSPTISATPANEIAMPVARPQPSFSRKTIQASSAANGTEVWITSAPVPASICSSATNISPKCSVPMVTDRPKIRPSAPCGIRTNGTSVTAITAMRSVISAQPGTSAAPIRAAVMLDAHTAMTSTARTIWLGFMAAESPSEVR